MESTRIARIGNSGQEIHLKKNIEVTREIADQINQLPTSDTDSDETDLDSDVESRLENLGYL